MITVHRHIMYIIFFAIGFFLGGTVFADAYTINFGEAPNNQLANPITIDYNSNDFGTNFNSWQLFVNNADGSPHIDAGCESIRKGENITEVFDVISFYDIELYFYDSFDCSGDVIDSTNIYQIQGNVPYFMYTQGIGFINKNNINTDDMLASVRSGTVETSKKTLPLIVFVGIPLAFAILIGTSALISNSVKKEKEPEKFNRRAFNKKANELENFYSKKGTSGAPYDIK